MGFEPAYLLAQSLQPCENPLTPLIHFTHADLLVALLTLQFEHWAPKFRMSHKI